MRKIILQAQVKKAIEMLRVSGYDGYVVGGALRDFILQKEPTDIDITTNAIPPEIVKIFSEYKVIETGIKHGTVTVVIESFHIEITTYRVDGKYSDNRHPDFINFTLSLKEDLARRDFTMNAIAYNEKDGIIDFYNGEKDISEKTIRCVGDAFERFKEDALRIFRAVRFASVLSFEIEEQTHKAMQKNKELLLNVSVERLYVELSKMLCGEDIKNVLLKYIDIIGVIIPELLPLKGLSQNNPYHIYDALTHTAVAVSCIENVLYLKIAMLFHDLGKAKTYTEDEKGIGHFYGHSEISEQMARDILRRLKVDKFTLDRVCILIKYHDLKLMKNKRFIKKWLNKLSKEVFMELLLVKKADDLAKNESCFLRIKFYEEIKEMAEEIIAEGSCFNLCDLKVNGKDLINIGITRGDKIGKTLKLLLEGVIDDEIPNEKDDLLKTALKINE
ncbi:MAG: HD domain-containing protein [Clostridia bacterium]